MKAELTTNGFRYNGNVIQGSYTFSNIKLMGDTEHQTVYSAIMNSPINVPCLITIIPNKITINTVDGNNINISY